MAKFRDSQHPRLQRENHRCVSARQLNIQFTMLLGSFADANTRGRTRTRTRAPVDDAAIELSRFLWQFFMGVGRDTIANCNQQFHFR